MNPPRVVNDAGRRIIMDSEGCRLDAYLCPAKVPTIGYGHTGDVKIGDRITQHQADVILEADLQRFEMAVEQLAPGLSANQFSALVSFAFNLGVGALEHSTLLRYVLGGQMNAAAAEFGKWTHAAGAVLPGLVKRREAERVLFLTPVS